MSRFSDAQIWIINFLLVTLIFLFGIWVGGWSDPSMETITETVEVPTGEFEDVPMVMSSNRGGGPFTYLCDLHLDQAPTAECEYRSP